MGVAVLAGTIVSLMLFNGLFQKREHMNLALLQVPNVKIFLLLTNFHLKAGLNPTKKLKSSALKVTITII